jgi:hypothetical protein
MRRSTGHELAAVATHIDKRQLAQLTRAYQRKKLWDKIGYDPHPKQRAIHAAIDAGAKRLIDVAGRRGGKSESWATEMLTEMAYGPIGHLPKRLCLIAGPEGDITDRIFGYLWRWIVDERILNGAKPLHMSTRSRYIEMPWHSRVEGKTTEDPRSLRGDGVVMTVADEYAFGEDIVKEHLIPPLADCNGILGLVTTPNGQNHTYSVWLDWLAQAQHDPFYSAVHWTSYENPHLPAGYIARIENEYRRTGSYDIFRQEYLAEFVALQGAVYPQFSAERHVHAFEPTPGVPLDIGMDWGFDHPFVAEMLQFVSDDQVLALDEVYLRGLTDGQKVTEVWARLKHWQDQGLEIGVGYGDPSSPQAIRAFRESGLPMWEPGDSGERLRINSVLDGISVVRGLLGREDKPGLLIHPRCEQLIRTLPLYKFKDSDRTEKDAPVKRDDDPPDALRYACMARLGGTRFDPSDIIII